MMRTMTLCLGNLVLFILMGLAFLFPFSEYSLVEGGFGIMFRPTVFPLLLLAYLVVYPILYAVLSRRFGWRGRFGRRPVSELSFSDERERAIVGEASKASYLVLVRFDRDYPFARRRQARIRLFACGHRYVRRRRRGAHRAARCCDRDIRRAMVLRLSEVAPPDRAGAPSQRVSARPQALAWALSGGFQDGSAHQGRADRIPDTVSIRR